MACQCREQPWPWGPSQELMFRASLSQVDTHGLRWNLAYWTEWEVTAASALGQMLEFGI